MCKSCYLQFAQKFSTDLKPKMDDVCKGINLSNDDNDDNHIDLNRPTGRVYFVLCWLVRVHKSACICFLLLLLLYSIKIILHKYVSFCFSHKWFVACIHRIRKTIHSRTITPKTSCKNAFYKCIKFIVVVIFVYCIQPFYHGWSAIVIAVQHE